MLVTAYVVLASTVEVVGQGEFFKRGTEVLVIGGLLYLGVPRVLTTALLGRPPEPFSHRALLTPGSPSR